VLISVEYSYARNANETERIYKLDVLAIAIFWIYWHAWLFFYW